MDKGDNNLTRMGGIDGNSSEGRKKKKMKEKERG
jgi:hypothetical protein